MAQRRMFSKRITDTDIFTDMPLSTQCLYFHLNMNGDDDGFVDNTKRVQKMIGASEDDLKLLFAKEFLIPFESGVVVIKDWKIHNFIRKDRYQETIYIEEKTQLITDKNGKYEVGQPPVDQRLTQGRLGKDRLGKVRLEEDNEFEQKRSEKLKKELVNKSSSSIIFEFYESNGFGTLGPFITESVDGWLSDIESTGTNEEESGKVILEAMKIAVVKNARNWNYVNQILINWEQRGLNTVNKVLAAEKSREVNKNKGNSYSKNQSARKESLPGWAKDGYEQPKSNIKKWTEEEEREYEKMMEE